MDASTIGAVVGAVAVSAVAAVVTVLRYKVPRRPLNGSQMRERGLNPGTAPSGAIDAETWQRWIREIVRTEVGEATREINRKLDRLLESTEEA